MILDSVVEEFAGEKFLQSVKIKNLKTGDKKELKVDGVFVEVGHEVRSDFLKDLVKLDEQKQIVVSQNCETFYPNTEKVRPGIFAAGDATTSLFKQIVISSGDGAKAGLQAYSYVTKKGTGTDRSVGYGK
jgi:thioredoxin reductase (NADPH)